MLDSNREAAALLLSLPAEIRNSIFEHVYDESRRHTDGFKVGGGTGEMLLDGEYSANIKLQCLLACRQLYKDTNLLAFHKTNFFVTSLFSDIPERLSMLQPEQKAAIRSIGFVADRRHFSKIHVHHWGHHPFGISELDLDTLTIVLHRSSAWHYLFDYTANIVQVLRQLQGVKRLVFVRNKAHVKGSFKTWYNRLIGLMLKVDHQMRYNTSPSQLEETWWTWSFNEAAQTFSLEAQPSKPLVDEMTYIEDVLPLLDELRVSVESEEWNPDPRSRNGA